MFAAFKLMNRQNKYKRGVKNSIVDMIAFVGFYLAYCFSVSTVIIPNSIESSLSM